MCVAKTVIVAAVVVVCRAQSRLLESIVVSRIFIILIRAHHSVVAANRGGIGRWSSGYDAISNDIAVARKGRIVSLLVTVGSLSGDGSRLSRRGQIREGFLKAPTTPLHASVQHVLLLSVVTEVVNSKGLPLHTIVGSTLEGAISAIVVSKGLRLTLGHAASAVAAVSK